MQTVSDEKRNFARVPFSSKANIRSSDTTISGTIGNVSINGAFVKASQKIEVGRNLEIELFLTEAASDMSIVLSAVVVRHTPDGIGIRFTGMYLDDFERLKEIVANGIGDKKKVVEEFLKYMAG